MASINNITPSSILSNINTGLDFLLSLQNTDVVAIFDQQTMQQVFENARPMKASVKETSRVMDYPVESGAVLSDHHIINPVEISIPFIINSEYYAEAYQQMRTAWIAATALSIQTRTGVYSNMIIADMPHDEAPDMFDAITVAVRFREVILVVPSTSDQPSNYSPLNPVNGNTITRGFQLAKTLINQTGAAASYIRAGKVFGL